MTEGKQHDQWNYASAMMALLANLNRNAKKGRALRPIDFHPLARKSRSSAPIKSDISVLKSIFVDQRPGRC